MTSLAKQLTWMAGVALLVPALLVVTSPPGSAAQGTTRACSPMYGFDWPNLHVRNVRCPRAKAIIREGVRKANQGRREFRIDRFRCTAQSASYIVCTRNAKWIRFDNRE